MASHNFRITNHFTNQSLPHNYPQQIRILLPIQILKPNNHNLQLLIVNHYYYHQQSLSKKCLPLSHFPCILDR